MTREYSETARRRFVQVLGAGAVAGGGVSNVVAAGDNEPNDTVQADDDGDEIDPGLITIESNADFETTVARVEAVLEAEDLVLVTTIDHAENAASVDESLPPTTLFLFDDPAVGTPFIQLERSVAIDLPQKLLVWEDEGTVFLTYNDLQFLATRHGIDAADEQLTTIADSLEQIVTAIARGE